MKIDIIHSNSPNDIVFDAVKVEPISKSLMGDVKRRLFQTNPAYMNIPIDNAFVLYVSINNSPSILGIICVEPNDVRTKYKIQGTDIETRNYHEFTYFLIDDRLFNKETLVPILQQIFSMIISDKPIDEVFWFSDGELYSRFLDKIFKTCKEYYFINEAGYFANKIISAYNRQIDRATYIEQLKKKYAPE